MRKVRFAAVDVDERFADHRPKIASKRAAILDDLTPTRIASAKPAYHRLLPDEDIRLDGFVGLDDRGVPVGNLPEAPTPISKSTER